MIRTPSTSARRRRRLALPLLAALLVCLAATLTACGGEEPSAAVEETSDAPSAAGTPDATEAGGTTASPEPGGTLCDRADEVSAQLDLLEPVQMTEYPADYADRVAEADETNQSVEPPAEIAESWRKVGTAFTLVAAAYDGLDSSDPGDRQLAGERLGNAGLAALQAAGPHADTIRDYLAQECGAGAGTDTDPAAVESACDLVTDEDLATVFPDGAPAPEESNLGADFLDCVWETPDEERHLSVMLVPVQDFRRDFLKDSPPGEPVQDLPDGRLLEGVIGLMRFSTTGHSVSFTTGTQGGFLSVRTGSAAEEKQLAVRLAKAAWGRL